MPSAQAVPQNAVRAAQNLPRPVQQLDNDCGIYALSYALRVLHGDNVLPPRKLGVHGNSIRQQAKANGFSMIGEMFSAADLATLARRVGNCDAECEQVTVQTFGPTIKGAIDNGCVVLVPFNVNGAGDPVANGGGAHWCAVVAYRNNMFYAAHWGGFYKYPAGTFALSNASIVDWQAATWVKIGKSSWVSQADARTYHMPVLKERIIPAAQLSQTLRSRVVIVY